MIISLKTDRAKLQSIFEIPVIGPFLFFLLALLPVPLLFISNGFLELVDNELIERTNALITGIWNILLCWGLRVNISFIFVPCWILFSVIGALRYFYIIGGH